MTLSIYADYSWKIDIWQIQESIGKKIQKLWALRARFALQEEMSEGKDPSCYFSSWLGQKNLNMCLLVVLLFLLILVFLLCNSPGPGGKNCRGASVEHTVCENLPCPKGVPSFRDQQCQAHDRYTNKKKSLLTAVVVDGKFFQLPLYFLAVLPLQLINPSWFHLQCPQFSVRNL